jgi:NAD(P)-dependent dehydrogenase (short-subunit alcohol dehydrogenase family)
MTKPGAVLITGAGRGLGAELVVNLAGIGYPIVAMGRDEAALRKLANRVIVSGGSVEVCVGDARDSVSLARGVAVAEKRLGGLYGVIANAGVAGPTKPIQDIADAEWEEVVEVNLTAPFRLCRVAVPVLAKNGRGRIIFIGSVTGKRPLAGRTPYSATKLGLVGLARTLAVDVGKQGITVNVISPWLLEGARLDTVMASQGKQSGMSPREVLDGLLEGTVTGRPVSSGDVSAAVEFMLDERNGAITGQDLNISAGAVMY